MLQMPSFHLSYPDARGVRSALASGAVAGLVVLAACSDVNTTGPQSAAPAGPRNSVISSGAEGHGVSTLAGLIQVCVDATSPAGTYSFVNSAWNSGKKQDGTTVDVDNTQYEITNPAQRGTTTFPVGSTSTPYNVAVGPGGCVTVLNRTVPSTHYSATDDDGIGPNSIDDFQAVTIAVNSMPAGVVFDRVDCVLDIGTWTPSNLAGVRVCNNTSNPSKAYANYDHGSQLIFVFALAPQDHNCTYTQGYYKNHESYTAGVLSGNLNTTYINGLGQLLIGAYALSAAQVDAILGTPVGKGYNAGGVVFTKDQLGMIHQLITAELNIAGGAAPGGISAIITAANAGYTSATKSQLSSWTNALDDFNRGTSGVPHC